MASNKHRRNKITYFKDYSGNWINDPVAILQHKSQYFQNMFDTNHTSTDWSSIKRKPSNFNHIDLTVLDKQLLPTEVVNSIFSFKLFKASASMAYILSFTKNIGSSRALRY